MEQEKKEIDLIAQEDLQPSLNIGSIGHVAHGKSTIVYQISGKRTQVHKQELEKNMTIKLGYANAKIWKCPKCPGDCAFQSTGPEKKRGQVKCKHCGSVTDLAKHISFVDCPGHEVLMATMLDGAAVMDAALLVVAANQICPSPQTKEHLTAAELMGLRNILVVQNKIDLPQRSAIYENYKDIKRFLKNSSISEVPIIPVCAQQGRNIDTLCRYITEMPVPKRDITSPPLMMVVRSFDVNKPGEVCVESLQGAVVGGSLIRGQLHVGQTIEMRPGTLETTSRKGYYKAKPVRTKILSMLSEKNSLTVALPGGLIALGTTLDPSLGKGDRLVGQVIGLPGKMPGIYQEIIVSYIMVERSEVTASEDPKIPVKTKKFKTGEILKLNIGSQTTTANVTGVKADLVRLFLSVPVCAQLKTRVAISTKDLHGHASLVAMGMIIRGTPMEEQ